MPIFEYVCGECNHRFELLVYGSTQAACRNARPRSWRNKFLRSESAVRMAGCCRVTGSAHAEVAATRVAPAPAPRTNYGIR